MEQTKQCLLEQKRYASDPVEIVCAAKVKWENLAKIYNVLYGMGLTDITFQMTEPPKNDNVRLAKNISCACVLLTISLPAFAADSLPTAQDINDAAQKAKQIYDSFFTQTFTIRMQYEYSGRFLNPQDKDTLLQGRPAGVSRP